MVVSLEINSVVYQGVLFAQANKANNTSSSDSSSTERGARTVADVSKERRESARIA